MRKRILGVLALTIAFLLGSFTNSRVTGVRAQTQTDKRLQGSMSIPKDWGTLRGVSDKYLVFEDSAGTIRMAFIESGLDNFVQVQRP